jgi:hypothetical protein
VNVPVTVKFAIDAPSLIPTLTLLFEIVVSIWSVSPSKVNVSPLFTVSLAPLSPAISNVEATLAVVADVTRPLASIVSTGTCVVEP